MKEKKSMVLIRYNLRLYAYWQWSTRWIVLPLMNNSCSILIGPFTLCVGNLHHSRTMWAFVILKLVFVCCFFSWVTMDNRQLCCNGIQRYQWITIVSFPFVHLVHRCNERALSLSIFHSRYTRTIEQHTGKTTFIIFFY